MPELDGSKPVAACRFLSRRRQIGGRCVDGDCALDPALEQLEAQRTDARPDIEQRALNRTGVAEQIAKQPSRWCRSFFAVFLQLAFGDLLVEVCAGHVAVGRTACAHAITLRSTAACARRHSRRRLRISWPRAPWTFLENNRTVPSRRHHRSPDVRAAQQALPPAERRRFNRSISRYCGGSTRTARWPQLCRRTGTARPA
jgi:hypothetical protein